MTHGVKPALTFGLIIIGDEILSGKRADKHFVKVLDLLSKRGLHLSWAEIIGDDPARIVATLKRTMATADVVFCCGGIGATPDDHTRQCAADALGVKLAMHPQAMRKVRERISDLAHLAGHDAVYDSPENRQRFKMVEFPAGAGMIPNPYNKIAGFMVASHYFVPGFPIMAGPMIEWVLDTYYADYFHEVAHSEHAILVFGAAESLLTPMMEAIEAQYPLVKVFSLPCVGDEDISAHIELGVKGDPEQALVAFATMEATLNQMNIIFTAT